MFVAVHSFTPEFKGESRSWHAGVLYHRDARLAHIVLALLRAEEGLVVGDNQPYSVSDESDYAIPIYGERRAIPHVEIEIRQDLLADEAGLNDWTQRLVRVLGRAEDLISRRR